MLLGKKGKAEQSKENWECCLWGVGISMFSIIVDPLSRSHEQNLEGGDEVDHTIYGEKQ